MASDVVRSIQIRMKFIEENSQLQKRAITEKTKVSKEVVPYNYIDILKL